MSRITNDPWTESALQYNSFEKRWHFYGTVATALLRQMRIPEDARVLELACGTGACTLDLAKAAPRGSVVALDLSEGMLSVAQDNMKAAGILSVSFVHGSATDVSQLLSGRKFDLVVCNSAFWQFPETEKVLQGLRDLLTDSGEFGLSLPAWADGNAQAREAFRSKVREILLSHGVSAEDVERQFAQRPYRPDIREVFEKSGFTIREESFEFKFSQESREEWSRIPVFSERRRRDWPGFDLDPETQKQVREELSEWRKANFPRDSTTSRWRLYIARPSAGRPQE